jgi:MoaA/NifB/PqqE/SkfB family radical SAM enzyme
LSPLAIQIDASAHCQLACPSCPTASGATRAAMSAGHLDPTHFQKLLDENPQLREVELSNYGEMFLNPRLHELLRIAFERQVVLHAYNGTNLNHATPETLEALIRYRMGTLSVSIDGASQET